MQIHGYSQLTLLDYPGKLACTIFCGRCNFRCPFCHNASLVLHPDEQPALDENKILEHIRLRKSMLEGICVTGGEPTVHSDLPEFLGRLRETGFLIKLDTNGTNPSMLEYIINERLVDHIAMDIKASPANYSKAAGLKSISMDNLFRSVDLIMSSGVGYEFRTTVVDGIHTSADFEQIGRWIKGADAYYLQQYKNSGDLILPDGLRSPSFSELNEYRSIMLPYVPNTVIRGAE